MNTSDVGLKNAIENKKKSRKFVATVAVLAVVAVASVGGGHSGRKIHVNYESVEVR